MNDLFTKTDYSLYSNAMTFVRRPYVRNPVDTNADVVVLGVPLDMATSGRPGLVWGLTRFVVLRLTSLGKVRNSLGISTCLKRST